MPLTLASINEIEADWQNLLDNSIEQTVYLSPWFVSTTLELFRNPKTDLILVYHKAELIGLVLLESDKGYAKLPVGFLKNSIHPHQFLGTPLVRANSADLFATGLYSYLDTSRLVDAFILIRDITDKSEIAVALERVANSQGRRLVETNKFERAMIMRRDEHSVQISKNRRKSLNRKRKALSEIGTITIERLSNVADAQFWFEDFARLENTGWKQKQKTSIAENPNDYDSYLQLVPAAIQNNALNFFRLKINDKPISYTIDFKSGDFIYCHRCAYDLEYKKYTPGVLMEYETLKFYTEKSLNMTVDSCTSPQNDLLNELWPDKKPIVTIAVSKTGFFYTSIFSFIHWLKAMLKKSKT